MDAIDEAIRSKRLRALVRYWDDKRQTRPMPLRRNIDPIEIPSLLPIVVIAETSPNGPRIRLLGSETTSVYGRELRGQLIGDIEFDEFTPLWRESFAMVADTAMATAASGTFLRTTGLCTIELALMPLADDTGGLSHVFGGVVIRPLAWNSAIRSNSRPIYRSGAGGVLNLRQAELRRC
jgi:hypothetical protein